MMTMSNFLYTVVPSLPQSLGANPPPVGLFNADAAQPRSLETSEQNTVMTALTGKSHPSSPHRKPIGAVLRSQPDIHEVVNGYL